jgi:hypothetical protein
MGYELLRVCQCLASIYPGCEETFSWRKEVVGFIKLIENP